MDGYSETASVDFIGGTAIAQTPDVIDPETSEYVVETDRCLHIRTIGHLPYRDIVRENEERFIE